VMIYSGVLSVNGEADGTTHPFHQAMWYAQPIGMLKASKREKDAFHRTVELTKVRMAQDGEAAIGRKLHACELLCDACPTERVR
jgi:hypothetical protein